MKQRSALTDDPTGAGLFDIELTNLESAKQEYVRNTAILVTTLTDDAGATVQITDLAPRFKHYGRLFRAACSSRSRSMSTRRAGSDTFAARAPSRVWKCSRDLG